MDSVRVNKDIKAKEVRLIDQSGENLGVMPLEEALSKAKESDLDLIEVSPGAKPPVAKIMDYGKYSYEQKKKQKEIKTKSHTTETKNIQVKTGTGEHDLALKAKNISKWLKEGHRVKLDLYLRGRSKYLDRNFLEERLKRVLHLVTEDYKITDGPKKSHKGLTVIVEKE